MQKKKIINQLKMLKSIGSDVKESDFMSKTDKAEEAIFNVVDPNAMGDTANRVRPISISLSNETAEGINEKAVQSILSILWNDTWQEIAIINSSTESLEQDFTDLKSKLESIQKLVVDGTIDEASTQTEMFLNEVKLISDRLSISASEIVEEDLKGHGTIILNADNTKAAIKVSQEYVDFLFKKLAKVDKCDFTSAAECHIVGYDQGNAEVFTLSFEQPVKFRSSDKRGFLAVTQNDKAYGMYKCSYEKMSSIIKKLSFSMTEFGWVKDSWTGCLVKKSYSSYAVEQYKGVNILSDRDSFGNTFYFVIDDKQFKYASIQAVKNYIDKNPNLEKNAGAIIQNIFFDTVEEMSKYKEKEQKEQVKTEPAATPPKTDESDDEGETEELAPGVIEDNIPPSTPDEDEVQASNALDNGVGKISEEDVTEKIVLKTHTVDEIASKWATNKLFEGKSIDQVKNFIENQIAKGTLVEMEHTDDRAVAKQLASVQVFGIPDFYDRHKIFEEDAKKDLGVAGSKKVADKEFRISGDELRKLWGSGKSIMIDGKEYSVHKMSYGDYFLEPIDSFTSETEGFGASTIWLKKVDPKLDRYKIEASKKVAEELKVKKLGKSYTATDIAKALKMSKGWEVFSATDASSFNSTKWHKDIIRAEVDDRRGNIFFTLKDGSYIELENPNPKKEASTKIEDGKSKEANTKVANDEPTIADIEEKGTFIDSEKVDGKETSCYEYEGKLYNITEGEDIAEVVNEEVVASKLDKLELIATQLKDKKAGYSTEDIDVAKALAMSKGWEVISADDEDAFKNNQWRKEVVRAQIQEGGNIIFFKTEHGFVDVEKPVSKVGKVTHKVAKKESKAKECPSCHEKELKASEIPARTKLEWLVCQNCGYMEKTDKLRKQVGYLQEGGKFEQTKFANKKVAEGKKRYGIEVALYDSAVDAVRYTEIESFDDWESTDKRFIELAEEGKAVAWYDRTSGTGNEAVSSNYSAEHRKTVASKKVADDQYQKTVDDITGKELELISQGLSAEEIEKQLLAEFGEKWAETIKRFIEKDKANGNIKVIEKSESIPFEELVENDRGLRGPEHQSQSPITHIKHRLNDPD